MLCLDIRSLVLDGRLKLGKKNQQRRLGYKTQNYDLHVDLGYIWEEIVLS